MKLRSYQIDLSTKGAEKLHKFKIVYFAIEPRCGKTIISLETCRKYGAKKVLFVTKKKAISSIESDALHYPDLDVTVINYESVLKKVGVYDIIICDEAHSISTFPKPSKRIKDLKQITTGLPIIYLSATPAPESHSQFYHQFFISSYSPFKNYISFYKWANDFVNKKIKYLGNRQVNDFSEGNMTAIKSKIDHLFIKFTQKESGFDVSINEKTLIVPMDDVQRLVIDKLLKDNIVKGKSGKVIIADSAVKLQSKIHQICSGTVIDEDGNIIIISDTKAKYIKDKFKSKKIAIFYKFKGEFEVLKKTFKNWTADPMEFQNSIDKTFLGQFVSSREGIRLDSADSIVFYNIDFSHLSYAQAKDRIISKERTKQAVLYWVFTNGGIEQKVYKSVMNKKDYVNYTFKKDYNVGTKSANTNKKVS